MGNIDYVSCVLITLRITLPALHKVISTMTSWAQRWSQQHLSCGGDTMERPTKKLTSRDTSLE